MKKVMVVDDNIDSALTVKYALEDESGQYEVIGANSGKHCFELLENGQIPDLILLDIRMPDMNGWAVCDRLKAKESPYKNIPIIFLTVLSEEIQKDFRGSLVEDIIAKPFEATELKNKIDKFMKNQYNWPN